MLVSTIAPAHQLAGLGQYISEKTHYQSSPDQLVQDTLRLNEGVLNDSGALVISTGEFTGRSPKDKYIVKDGVTSDIVDWNDFNHPLTERYFDVICQKMFDYLEGLPELWVRDCSACADTRYRLGIRVINEKPWGNLFAYNMFIRDAERGCDMEPNWQLFCAPGLKLNAAECGTRTENAVVISFSHKMVLITGTGYTGEIKKSIFTVLNYLLPQNHQVLSMHCSANTGDKGDTALFFGLSGTGKTTLSADPNRRLIGDDEHGWAKDNIFNFEGGCYAKVINLKEEMEPEIFGAIRQGALVENTVFHGGTRVINYSSAAITENTRVSYPIPFISNAQVPSVGNIPSNIFFLTCDAYGILPPISKLSTAQAMYQFISGYTAKIAGTEAGLKEPVHTFSACFGAPFLPLHPGKYASMLGEKLRRNRVTVWLVNTGWTGGPYGKGSRIPLAYTRNMINAALNERFANVRFDTHPVFKMDIPQTCPGVPPVILYPRDTWQDKDEYDTQCNALALKFIMNFCQYANGVDAEIAAAGPVYRD